jgi:hypothetical protein
MGNILILTESIIPMFYSALLYSYKNEEQNNFEIDVDN